MRGFQTIYINRPMTLIDLEQFMQEHWDTEQCDAFVLEKEMHVAGGPAILLPASQHFMIVVRAVPAGKGLHRRSKIQLSVTENVKGIEKSYREAVSGNIIWGGIQNFSKTDQMSMERERRGPAEKSLLMYSRQFSELLEREGLLD